MNKKILIIMIFLGTIFISCKKENNDEYINHQQQTEQSSDTIQTDCKVTMIDTLGFIEEINCIDTTWYYEHSWSIYE